MGLVAGVDDGPLQGGLKADLFFEEIGPLGYLELHLLSPGCFRPHLAGAGEDLAGHEVRDGVLDHPGEGHGPVHQVVLVGAVRVALAVRVVLVHADLLARRQEPGRRLHGAGQDGLARLVVQDRLPRRGALRPRELGVGVVDVVTGAVGEHGVDQVRLDLGRHGRLALEAPGVPGGRLVLEVPFDAPRQRGHIGVDQRGRGGDGIGLAPAPHDDPVLGLHAEDFHYGHGPTLPRLGGQEAVTRAGERREAEPEQRWLVEDSWCLRIIS